MKSLPLALTQGDPSGIGPELTLRAYCAQRSLGSPEFFVIGDPALYSHVAQQLKIDIAVQQTTPQEAISVFSQALPVVPSGCRVRGAPGKPDSEDAPGTTLSIERAVQFAARGTARGVVTCPIAKSVLYKAGFQHSGHTEFLGELAERFFAQKARPVMMLWAQELAVVPITIHVAASEVPRLLTRELVVSTGRIVAADLTKRFGISAPRLAFSGLNPHAGEDGAMGREEIDVLAPAIVELRASGIDARGPFPADTLFHAAARENYDVALCPTHDQALIPIKTLAFDRGVNVTLGLPFIRTSPDHGTAFDIAGKGIADPTSLIEAIRLAGRLNA